MEVEELGKDLEDKTTNRVCNFCFKSFPCGRSLDAHTKSHHVILNPTDHFTDFETDLDIEKVGFHHHRQDGERICKECGKCFQSLKALCGHMACHSEKVKILNDDVVDLLDHSWDNCNKHDISDQNLVMDSQSDTETGFPIRQRRSRRLRYKNFHEVNNKHSSVSIGNNNCSSSVSGIEQEQDQDVAMCLMMLSRDYSGNWGGFNSFADSSDNISVVLEARTLKKCQNYVALKLPNEKKSSKSDSFNSSGYFQNGIENDESEVCGDGLYKNGRLDGSDEFFDNEKKTHKRSKFECFVCYKIFHSPQALGGHIASHKKNNGYLASGSTYESGENGENSLDNDISPYQTSKYNKKAHGNGEKKSKNGRKYECPVCFKVLKSGQALGGHKRIHNVASSAYINKRNPMVIKHGTTDLIDLNFPPPN